MDPVPQTGACQCAGNQRDPCPESSFVGWIAPLRKPDVSSLGCSLLPGQFGQRSLFMVHSILVLTKDD